MIGDLDALARRLDVIVAGSDEAAAHAKEEKEQSRAASTARKEALAVEAEQIGSESTQWKTAGDRLREILDEWKTIRGIDRKVDDALWKRYSKARESFNRRRGAHFAELDRDRASARSTKEELVERAEKLSTSTEWGQTAGEFRDLLSEWKAAGRAPREADDNLWKRFKGAQDVFFAARNAAASERDAEFEQNAVAKEELLAANANIDPAHGLENARAALRDLQEKWDAIGKVPRDRMQELEAKLRAIETKVRDAVDAEWRRTDPEALARVAQFKERVSQFEEQAAKAQAAGKTKDARRLSLRPSSGVSGPKLPKAPSTSNRGRAVKTTKTPADSERSQPALSCALDGRPAVSADVPFLMLLGFGRSDPALLLGGELNVGSCPDHLEPMERQEHDGKPSDDQPDRRSCHIETGGNGLTRPDGHHAESARHGTAGECDPGQTPTPRDQREHRESDAEDDDEPHEQA